MAPRFTINQTCDSFTHNITHNITISNIGINGYDAFNMYVRIDDVLRARNGKVPLHEVFRILGVSLYVPEPLERMTKKWIFTKNSKMKMLSGEIVISDLAEMWTSPEGYKWIKEGVSDMTVEKVIFHDPATIVYWKDGTKTVVKCGPNDTYSKETGLALCYMKKVLGNKGNYNDVFRKWIKEEDHD